MPKGKYIHKGDVLDLVNSTENAIGYGDVVPIGARIGIAGENIAAGSVGSVHVVGVFELPAENDAAFAVGDVVYWDNTAGELTKTAGDYKAGFVTEAKTSAGTIARVKID